MRYKSHLLLHNPKKKKLMQLQLVSYKISLILYRLFLFKLFMFFAPIFIDKFNRVKNIRDFSIFTEVYLTPEYSNNMRSIRILYTVHTD